MRPILFSLDHLFSKLLRWSQNWEELTQDRSKQRSLINEGDKPADEKRTKGAKEKSIETEHLMRKSRAVVQHLIDFGQPWQHMLRKCGRHFVLGLVSSSTLAFSGSGGSENSGWQRFKNWKICYCVLVYQVLQFTLGPKPKHAIFPYLFSDLASKIDSKIHSRFQTWLPKVVLDLRTHYLVQVNPAYCLSFFFHNLQRFTMIVLSI